MAAGFTNGTIHLDLQGWECQTSTGVGALGMDGIGSSARHVWRPISPSLNFCNFSFKRKVNETRMYDPTVGRMLSPDIVIQQEHNSQAYNRYSYCFNNPLRFTDPSGYVTEEGWYRDSQGKLKFDARVHSQMDLYSLGIPGIFENDDDWRPTPPDIGAFNTEDSEGTTKTMRTNLEPDGNDFMEVVGAFSTMGGFTASLKEYSLVDKSGKRWEGNNRWYSMDYYGRKTGPTGYQRDVASKAEKANAVGKVFFAASVLISGFEIGNSIKEGDSDAVLLSGLDIGFGALGAFGGPYGFGFSAAYSFIKAVSTPSIIMDTKYQLKYPAPDKQIMFSQL